MNMSLYHNNPTVILVDEKNNQVGIMEKMEAHKTGALHRAFSVFIINSKGELLLQKRALNKYHSTGLWTNSCCSHQQPNENEIDSIKQRLLYEMGIECKLEFAFNYRYYKSFKNGLNENEFDNIYIGYSDDIPVINKTEVDEFAYLSLSIVQTDINIHSENYTYWFKEILHDFIDFLDTISQNT